ncbi:ribonuclease Oy-like [Phymastichus coffea]|uniref:ribonuclease Oy-like n=1 Tax=Phymastichus coffea TaxID=108790 RepID=UPI00273BE498|nr:ribonuclease Oy-like [Phymastichus coffea]
MWSPTACKNFRSKQHNSERACTSCAVSKAVNKWTIHGLWPSNGNNTGPYQCSGSKYEASLVNELRKELNEKWPSAMYDNDSFWSHEWKKHGTCSNLKATDTVTKYFSTSLRLFDAYNLGGILAEANILAGNNYTLDSLHGAIKRKLGVNVFVQCIRIKVGIVYQRTQVQITRSQFSLNSQFFQGKHEQYLSQVQLCFDKSLRLTDCDSGNGYLSSCERHYNVTYANSC